MAQIEPLYHGVEVRPLLCRRMRDLREDQEKTQAEIAELLCIPRKTYCNYENGRNNVPNEVLCALADYYHTSTDYLLGRTDNPAPPRR